MFQFHVERGEHDNLGKSPHIHHSGHVHCGTLLMDGRFEFLLVKKHKICRLALIAT
jgi:hypothetical protein